MQEPMTIALRHVAKILALQNPNKKWRFACIHLDEENLGNFSLYDQEYHHLRSGDDRILIYDAEGYLLYTVNVTGDSLTCAMAELFNLIMRKF